MSAAQLLDVAFERVTIRYRIDGPEVLSDISFHVPAGQFVGIVGASGSGALST